ncbi:hypothetical protein [Telmatospirillum siberiense]|uniref:Uncharacterized protein n=1 Tax=Telmatospirillum siberiense TaxID=382514 RepID=A0A2N3PYW7_9PROT|nr:hypothetical protein [Telmatospirillum siberiense]PKU25575.1 hypothetical protein CWS72_05805 [Telmatospirillum siberiense]
MDAPFHPHPTGSSARQPYSLGLSALVAGMAVFSIDTDLDLLGYTLIGVAILLLLHAGLNVAATIDCRSPKNSGLPGYLDRPPPHIRSCPDRESASKA